LRRKRALNAIAAGRPRYGAALDNPRESGQPDVKQRLKTRLALL